MPENISGLPPVQLLSRAENGVKAAEYALANNLELREDRLASRALLVVASVSRSTLLNEIRSGKSPASPHSLPRRERTYALSYVDKLIGEVTARAVLLGWDKQPQKEPQQINPANEYSPQYDACTEVLAQLDLLEAAKHGLSWQRNKQPLEATSNTKEVTQTSEPARKARSKKSRDPDNAWRERNKIRREQEKKKGQRTNDSSILTPNQRRNKKRQYKKRGA